MSRAVIYETFGGPEMLELRDVPEPHASPGEVRVRVTAAGLNPMDWILAARPEAAADQGARQTAARANESIAIDVDLKARLAPQLSTWLHPPHG